MENLFGMSNLDRSCGQLLAAMCEQAGIQIVKSSGLFSWVCNPCAQNIRNLFSLFNKIKNAQLQGDWEVLTNSSPTQSNGHLAKFFQMVKSTQTFQECCSERLTWEYGEAERGSHTRDIFRDVLVFNVDAWPTHSSNLMEYRSEEVQCLTNWIMSTSGTPCCIQGGLQRCFLSSSNPSCSTDFCSSFQAGHVIPESDQEQS